MNFLEHRLYLPLFGILLVLGQSKLVKKVPPRVGAAMVLIIAVAWGMISFRHQSAFADGVSFWSNAARTSPRSGLAHQMLGRQYFREGRTDEAIGRYLHSLSLEESPSAHNDLALAWMKKGAPDSAEVHFRRVLETDSSLANVHNNLALVYFQRGQWGPARRHLAQAERLSAGDPDPLLNTGVLMLELGRPDSAELYLRRALALDHHNPEVLLNLGVALSRQGRGEQALGQLLAARRLCPSHPLVNLRLAQLYLLSGRREEALAHYQAARQAGVPADPRFEE
jgi:Flp pilus assembly protein TadD